MVQYHNVGTPEVVVEREMNVLTLQEARSEEPKVRQAIHDELKRWIDLGGVERMDKSKATNVLDSRWVLKWKIIDGVREIKARLTARGYKDMQANDVNTYAGTATRYGQRLVNVMAVQRQWTLFSADIGQAFLRGMTFEQIGKLEGEIKREVQLTLPPGCIPVLQQIQGYEDFDPNREVLAMLRGGFGLKDAPRLWQLMLQQALERAGGRSLVSEPKLYVFEFQGQLQMIMSSHVDDLKGAGDDNTRSRVLKMLEQEFSKLKTQFGVFECIGIMHEQDEVTKEIWTHQHHYTRQLKTIVDEQYKMCDGDQQVTGNTYTAYRSLLGGVAWLAQTMMPVCMYISYLQPRSQAPTVNDVKKLNRLLRWIKANLASLGVQYGRLQEPLQLLCISDSAFKAKEYDGLAMRGCVILLASAVNDEKDKQDWKCIPLDWFAKKHTHVVRSTFAAELHSMLDAIGNALLLNLAFTEIQLGHVTIEGLAQMQEQGRLHLEVKVYIDAKSVYEAVCADPIKVPT